MSVEELTRHCERCGNAIKRNSKWSRDAYKARRYCNKRCQEGGRPDILTDFTIAENGCWNWLGHIDRNGYGKAYDGTMPKGRRLDWAHRVSYREHKGEIPSGYELDHTCQNTRCINPDHLDPVTKAEHAKRGMVRVGGLLRQEEAVALRQSGLTYGQMAEALRLAGKESAHSRVKAAIANGLVSPDDLPQVRKIDEQDAADIRTLYALGISQPEIAAWYRVDNSNICRIVSGRKSRSTAA